MLIPFMLEPQLPISRALHTRVDVTEKDRLNTLTDKIIGSAVAVHRELGPEMLESAYEACLTYLLLDRGLRVERQKALPLIFRGQMLDCGYRIDLLVEDSVVVEVKSTDQLARVHGTQVLSYLRLSRCKVGLLINFNVQWLTRDGVRRIVNGFPRMRISLRSPRSLR